MLLLVLLLVKNNRYDFIMNTAAQVKPTNDFGDLVLAFNLGQITAVKNNSFDFIMNTAPQVKPTSYFQFRTDNCCWGCWVTFSQLLFVLYVIRHM